MKSAPAQFPVNNNQTTFGLHLMLDAYGVPAHRLDDMKLVFKYLNDLPNIIGMTKLTTPMVVDCEATETGKDPGGISGFVMIAESHISIHTFAKRGFFTMDCYSCNNFEEQVEDLLRYTKEVFPYKETDLQIVKRGLSYPMVNLE